MRKTAAVLLLFAAFIVHPLTHVADEGLCPCVHGSTPAVSAPSIAPLERSEPLRAARDLAFIPGRPFTELPARAPPAA